MNLPSHSKRYALLALALVLASCSTLFPPHHRHVAKAAAPQPEYQAGDFVQHLSLASLSLADDAADMDSASPDLEVLEGYTSPPPPKHGKKHAKPVKEVVSQRVAVLECKTKADGSMQKLAAPFAAAGHDSGALLELVNQMNARACLLNNVWPAVVTVRRSPALIFNDKNPQQARQAVRERLDGVLQGALQPAPLADAKAQMQLARVFIDNRQRDGAYIAVENAKQALATAEKAPDNKAAVQALLNELEDMESELHQAMPFTL